MRFVRSGVLGGVVCSIVATAMITGSAVADPAAPAGCMPVAVAPGAVAGPGATAQAPPAQTPPTQAPPTQAPAAEAPPAQTPPVQAPPVETPPVETPPVQTPPVQTPAAQTPPAGDGAVDGAAAGCAPADTSAATAFGWGRPNRDDEFDGTALSGQWEPYDGPGHNGAGRRSPGAFAVQDGVLTVNGGADGTTGGMAWAPGQRYGRWEARVRSPAADPSYHAVLLLWPDAENWPKGGEVDFMEDSDPSRQNTDMFLHYGADNSQLHGDVRIDATQWHDWAVEWTPDHITAFVDGKQWWTTDDTSALPPGPMHLTVQLDWFPEGKGQVKASEMQVDWVRQYPLDPVSDR